MAEKNNNGSNSKSKNSYDPSLKPREFGELSQKEYIIERLNDQLKYYDKIANRSKRRYLMSRTVSVMAGALVPVFVNLHFSYVNVVTTTLSILVVLIVSLESVFHFREQWVNSRSTSETLRKEYYLFLTKEGQYRKKGLTPEQAFIIFVERVEYLIESENNSTLQVLTRELHTENQKSRQSGQEETG